MFQPNPRSNSAQQKIRRTTLLAGLLCALTLSPTAPSWSQPTDLAPTQVLLNGDPPPLDSNFGEAVAASGAFVFAAGQDLGGTTDYRAWVLQTGVSQWVPFFNQSSASSSAAQVGLQGSDAYRQLDDVADGFRIERLDLTGLPTGPIGWTEVWSPQNPNADLHDFDVSSSIFLDSSLVAAGWASTGVTTNLAVLRDQGPSASFLYSDSVVGGAPASVSADVDQVAFGLPGNGEVIIVVDDSPWIQESVLAGPISSTGLGADSFGAAVALRDNLLAVSAPGAEVCILPPSGCVDSGQVWVYTRVGSTWTFATPLFSFFGVEGGEAIGRSLRFSADGKRLAVGAPGASTTFLFGRDESDNWQLLARAKTSPFQDSSAGFSTAFAGNGDLFAGAPSYDDGSGAVGAALLFREAVFANGFESGDTNSWSSSSP